jgi:hypothetical protein
VASCAARTPEGAISFDGVRSDSVTSCAGKEGVLQPVAMTAMPAHKDEPLTKLSIQP